MPAFTRLPLLKPVVWRSTFGERCLCAALLGSVLALTCVGCGQRPRTDWTSKSGLAQIFRDDEQLRGQVLLGFDESGLAGAAEAYRLAHRQQEPVPYYRVKPASLSTRQLKERADNTIKVGFVYGRRPAFPLDLPVAWSADPYSDRSWRLWLNTLQPLDAVLAAHAKTGDERYLRFAEQLACDWISQNPVGRRSNPFAWYDMAVGLRALKLAYLTDAAARDPETDPETLVHLLGGSWTHGWHLAQERNFNAETNHGIYQAVGLLALGRSLPELNGAEAWRQLGEERLRTMFAKFFAQEGVHLEHSPGYHLSMTRLLIAVLESGLTTDSTLVSLRSIAEKSLAWMVAPDGRLPRLGDTDSHLLRPDEVGLPEARVAPELAYVVTHGRNGAPPEERSRILQKSGYAVFRNDWPGVDEDWEQCSYLIFSAGFHSRTHKHADDLTFEWWDAGRPLVVDAGRYGYYYDDPARVYCESTRAHNTVEIDGKDYSRHRRDAFGSAIEYWGEASGMYFVSARIQRDRPRLTQRRTLVFSPARWLVVVDELEAKESHRYEQWLHLHPDLSLKLDGKRATADLGHGRLLHIIPLLNNLAVSVEAIRGQKEPRMQGWTSLRHRSIQPNWALGHSVRRSRAAIATLLLLHPSPPRVARIAGSARVDPGQIECTWRADARKEGFILERGARPPRIRSYADGGRARDPGQ